MNTQRIEILKKAILEEPGDPFYPYALALEFVQIKRVEALEMLTNLLASHPHYLPTYYQAGLLSIELGDEQAGARILEKGIALATEQNNRKALHELKSLLENL